MADPNWIQAQKNGVVISLRIQPKASRNALAGLYGSPPRLKVRISAPPVEGQANEELVSFLSKLLKIAKSRITILRGDSGKTKDVFCEGIDLPTAQKLLLPDPLLEAEK